MPAQDRFTTRVVGLAVAAVLAYLVIRIFRPFAAPIAWAFLLAFLVFPAVMRLRRRLGGRQTVVAVLLTVALILGLVLPAAAIAVAFGGQAVELVQKLRGLAAEYQIRAPADLLTIPVVGKGIAWVDELLPVTAAQIQTWAVEALQRILQFLLSHSGAFLAGAAGVFGSLTLMLFVLFFFLRDGDTLMRRAIRLIPMDPKKKDKLFRYLGDVTKAVVFGTLVTAVVQGALIGIAFWITGMPSPVVFASLAFIASFVPFVGTSIVVLPATLYLLAQGVLWKAIFMVAWGVLVAGSADNFLRPALMSGRAEIGTLTAFFGVLGGIAAFGIVGLFIGPVILALVLALLEFAEETQAAETAAATAQPPPA
jgi:predicted PurR-regulated permease PerM